MTIVGSRKPTPPLYLLRRKFLNQISWVVFRELPILHTPSCIEIKMGAPGLEPDSRLYERCRLNKHLRTALLGVAPRLPASKAGPPLWLRAKFLDQIGETIV